MPARDIYDGSVQDMDGRIPRTWKGEGRVVRYGERE